MLLSVDEAESNAEVQKKKPSAAETIKKNVSELHEVIAYMDYSFERAFT